MIHHNKQASFHHLFSLAQRSHQKNDLEMAVNLYKQALLEIPDQPDALQFLGLVYSQQGDNAKAMLQLEKAVKQKASDLNLYINTAEVCIRLKQYDKAITYCNEAKKLTPSNEHVLTKLATAQLQSGLPEEAIGNILQALQINQENARAHFIHGCSLLAVGNYKSAIQALEISVRLFPEHAEAHNNLAIAYQEWDKRDEALKHYQLALQLNPALKEANKNIAQIYESRSNVKEAKKYFHILAAQDPSDRLLQLQGELVFPIVPANKEHLVEIQQQLTHVVENYAEATFTINELLEYHISFPSILNYQIDFLKEHKIKYARIFESQLPVLNISRSNGKPKVGFVVTRGHEGVFMKCMRGIVNNLPSTVFDIYVVCSAPTGEKILRPVISNPDIKFVTLPHKLEEALAVLQKINFDILHYWEIGTDTLNYFLPMCKPARIQCTSWGWPVTSGIKHMDYFISSEYLETPESDTHYSEKLIRFKKLPVYYYRPPVPAEVKLLAHFGLSREKNIYLCIQNLRKVQPDFDKIVAGIIKGDENALVCFIEDKEAEISALVKQRILSYPGVAQEKVYFLKRMDEPEYLSLLKNADVVLDTTHYGGGANTVYDAFACGTPVMTLNAAYHKGRYTTATYKAIGMDYCVTGSYEEYIEKAIKIAKDKSFRTKLSQEILKASDVLFEDKEAIVELHDFFVSVL